VGRGGSVRDTAAYLDALQGAGIGELFIIRDPRRPYVDELSQPMEKLQIAYSTKHTLGHEVDEECVLAVKNTVQLLKDLGHEVTETDLPYPKEALTKVFVTIIIGEASGDLEELKEHLGRKVKVGDVELNTWLLGALGKVYTAQEYVVQKRAWNEIARNIGQFHQKYDLFLTPTLSRRPISIGELQNSKKENGQLQFIKNFGLIKTAKNNGAVDQLAEKSFSYIPYTPIANMTGQPAMSVPLHWSKDGLPVGVHFTARICEEDMLIRLAAQLEKAQPWFDKRPNL
jgi:amidase